MRPLLVLLLVSGSVAQAQYFFTDNFASYNSGAWSKNGNPQFGGSGLTGDPGGSNSSVMAWNNGGNGTRHEIRATFSSFGAGGFYNSVDIYLAANAGLTSGYRLAFRTYNGTTVSLDVYDLTNSWFSLGGASFTVNPPTAVRAIKAPNGIRVVIGNQSAWIPVSLPVAGTMGLGFTGNIGGFTLAELAAGDVTAPGTVGAVAAWTTANQVDLQWTAATDNAGGSGVFRYNIYRNGVFIGSSRSLNYSDPAVVANTAYTYTVKAEDFHTNEGAGVNKVATTTPNKLQQTGVRPLGSYWGGGGENIDMQSGNLNYTLGMLKAQSRHGLSMGLALSYNSQTWRNGDGMVWNVGTDVGYGYGFKLLAGSVFPVYNGGTVSHYIFTDSTGAEYRLDVSWYNHYWSKEGPIVHFDPATYKLWFTDGSWWGMGATSAAPEQDAGTLYPTMVQDSNGNQIRLQYKPALGSATVNTSARLDWILDARAAAYPSVSYSFTYASSICGFPNEVPHLTGISTTLPTAENYSLGYGCQPIMAEPFGGAIVPGNRVPLTSRTVVTGAPGANLTYTFDWSSNGSLELWRVNLPYGGRLRWERGNIVAPSGQMVRGVNARYLMMSSGGTEYAYTLSLNSGTGITELNDADGKSRKRWEFEINPANPYYGLVKKQLQIVLPALTTMRQTDLTWAVNGLGNPYIQAQQTTIDVGQSYAKTMRSEQTVDVRGNLTQSKLFDFGNLATPKWVYNNTYLFTLEYETRFIWNRLSSTTLAFNGNPAVQYFQASYDGAALTNRPDSTPLWDYPNFMLPWGPAARGNLTSSGVPGFPQTTAAYDATGMPVSVTQGGTTTQVTSYDAKNVAPTLITTGSLSVSTQYNQIYETTQTTGPNGATTTAAYDTVARPTTQTAATGAAVTYAYSLTAPQVTATLNGRWTKSYMDGLGRAAKVETGNGGTVISTVETVYGPCGCSPMGKVMQSSLPYAPGGTKYWTVYTYDAAGRVINVALPNGAGSTVTLYEGNTTKVTSPAGKWKKQEVDAAGNLTKVTEPNPVSGGADWDTLYTYNDRNLLLTVSMTRPTGTQVRSFTYNNAGQVLTATNPENGTVTNTYSGTTGLLSQKVDAKGSTVTYVYDTLKRPTEIHRWVAGVEQADQLVKLYYDANAAYGANLSGRLAYTEFWSKRKAPGWFGAGSTPLIRFKEMYSYSTAGLMLSKKLWAESGTATDELEASYTFDNEGRMTGQTYPGAIPVGGSVDVPGEAFAYGFDSMGRPATMSSNAGATSWISGVTYDALGMPTVISTTNPQVAGETRTYNPLGQLTRIVSGAYRFDYVFSATQNDGRIGRQNAYLNGVQQESVAYLYDSLNRLKNALGSTWTAAYGYDGFTNLLSVTPSGAGPSAMNITVNPANNRVNGWSYDANGNTTGKPGFTGSYDVENRLQWASGPGGEEYYGYGADNRRVYQSKLTNAGTGATQELVTFWSGGKRAARYELAWSGATFAFKTLETNVYFGGKPLRLGTQTNVVTDRLGSVRREAKDFFPYGQERTVTPGETEKYATYMHDGRTDLAYADQRYYATGAGRFMTADPAGSGLNWYAYTGGDPVNNTDPRGLSTIDDFGSASLLQTDFGYINVGGSGAWSGGSTHWAEAEAAHLARVDTAFAANALNSGVVAPGSPLLGILYPNADLSSIFATPVIQPQTIERVTSTVTDYSICPSDGGGLCRSLTTGEIHGGYGEVGLGYLSGYQTSIVAAGSAASTIGMAGFRGGPGLVLLPLSQTNVQLATTFLGTTSGTSIVVPQGVTGPWVTRNGAGSVWYDGSGGGAGLSDSVVGVRVMDPTNLYPTGYASYFNATQQAVNPNTGYTIARSDFWWHLRLP